MEIGSPRTSINCTPIVDVEMPSGGIREGNGVIVESEGDGLEGPEGPRSTACTADRRRGDAVRGNKRRKWSDRGERRRWPRADAKKDRQCLG